MANILLVEDDMDIAQGIAEYLEQLNHELDFAYNGEQALSLLTDNQYDLVLLDVNLPYVDGFEVCQSLLQQTLTTIPVIMMTARGAEQDVLTGFKHGAWDYLIKPFSFAELSARINVCLAKHQQQQAASIGVLYRFGGTSLDSDNLTFSFQNQSMQLHQVGFDILKVLIKNAPNVVKTAQIHTVLWGDNPPESDPLRSHIYKLRKQLQSHFDQPFITTVKGVGYRFDVE